MCKKCSVLLKNNISEKWLQANAVVGFFPANSKDEDIIVFADDKREKNEGINEVDEEVECLKEKILNELGITQQTEMKERESLCKITLNKKAKKKIEQGNQALEAILQEIEPDLTRYNEIVYATAKVLSDICSDRSKNKRKKTNRRKKPLWKEKIDSPS